MSDAPERLWMFKDVLKPFLPGGGKINMGDTEYIRADLYEAERAENERLRLGIGRAMDRLRNSVFQNAEHIQAMNCLLDALKTKKGPGD